MSKVAHSWSVSTLPVSLSGIVTDNDLTINLPPHTLCSLCLGGGGFLTDGDVCVCVCVYINSCVCTYVCLLSLSVCACVPGTSRQVWGGCGSYTASRQGESWGMRWVWVKPSKSSHSWLASATANYAHEGPTTGTRACTHVHLTWVKLLFEVFQVL